MLKFSSNKAAKKTIKINKEGIAKFFDFFAIFLLLLYFIFILCYIFFYSKNISTLKSYHPNQVVQLLLPKLEQYSLNYNLSSYPPIPLTPFHPNNNCSNPI